MMARTQAFGPALALVLATVALRAQGDDFIKGTNGSLYYCPRIDLVPEAQGGPLDLEIDGVLDDVAWSRADWQTWSHTSDLDRGDPQPPDFLPVTEEEDLSFEWAALADQEFLYVAWRIVDDVLQNGADFHSQCDVWQDDSVEVYIDAKNDGPDCLEPSGEQCYQADDAQITVGAINIGKDDPNLLEFGGLAGYGTCDFAGPHPDVCVGMVTEIRDDEDLYTGWHGEIAIPLETIGNNMDLTPEWFIDPQHGTVIGWNIHGQDDDDGGGRDHKLMWSVREVQESAWRNPGAFGKMMFVDPTQEPPPLFDPVFDVTCTRNADGSVIVRWQNPGSADPAIPTRIEVDGVEVRRVTGNSAAVRLSEEQVPQDDQDHTIAVINNSDIAVECVVIGSPFDECGGIRFWNLLGAYDNPNGASPTDDQIRLDYMTDGEVGESEFEWSPGATINTDFGGSAASTLIDGGPAGRNPGGIPQVFERKAASARVFFQSAEAFGGNLDYVMAYAQTYVVAESAMDVYLGMSSDDSIQVILNGVQVWIHSIPRGGADACTPQDFTPSPVSLRRGANSLIVKIFDGEVDWDFAVRFQDGPDALSEPVTEGLSVSLTPPPPLVVDRLVRGDADSSGRINLTDGIAVLNWLFLGGPEPDCLDAADTDDSGTVNLTDAVRIFNWLFTGGPAPVSPSPSQADYRADDCGTDSSEEVPDLGCATRPEVCSQ